MAALRLPRFLLAGAVSSVSAAPGVGLGGVGREAALRSAVLASGLAAAAASPSAAARRLRWRLASASSNSSDPLSSGELGTSCMECMGQLSEVQVAACSSWPPCCLPQQAEAATGIGGCAWLEGSKCVGSAICRCSTSEALCLATQVAPSQTRLCPQGLQTRHSRAYGVPMLQYAESETCGGFSLPVRLCGGQKRPCGLRVHLWQMGQCLHHSLHRRRLHPALAAQRWHQPAA